MTNPISNVLKSEVILAIGTNTTDNHPIIANYMMEAIHQHGVELLVADPRRIELVDYATLWLRHNPGSDVALINGLMHIIIKENLQDQAYIDERMEGFEELKSCVEKYTPEYVSSITGISEEDLHAAARLYAKADPAAILYTMGITQHITGTDNVKSCANLAMLCGFLGVEGGGVNPLRGQNNVQGACDMGGLPDVYTAYQKVIVPELRAKMEAAWAVTGLPDQPGMTVTRMVPAAHEGKLKAMYVIGENPLVSDPDLNHAEKCFDNLDFLVVQDIFMTETAQRADVVLPSCCFAEKDGTFSNTERRIQRVRKAVNPPGEARDDWRIIADISARMGYNMGVESAEDIFEEIRKVTPSYAGISYARIDTQGLHWPCPTEDHPGVPILHVGQFTSGKGVFHGIDWIPPAEQADDEYPLYLTTGRVLYHYHTGTMTMKSEGLNERVPEGFVEISATDAERFGVEDGALADIASRRGKITTRIAVSDTAVAGTVFIPFHFAQAAANRLTNAALDPISGIPEFKVCAVRLSKAA